MNLTEKGISYLKLSAKWLRFFYVLSIIGIVFLFLGAVIMIVMGAAGMEGAQEYSLAIGIAYLVLACAFIFPIIYLKRMLDSLRVAFRTDEDAPLENSLMNFKSLLKFYGILEIVLIALSILAVIILTIVLIVQAVA